MNKITYLCNNNRHNVLNTTNGDTVMRHERHKGNGGKLLLVIVGMYIIFTYIVSTVY